MTKSEFKKYSDILLTCPLFAGMSEEDIFTLPLVTEGSVISLSSNEKADPDHLYITLKGALRIEKTASDGRNISMSTVLPGAAVNAASVLRCGKKLSSLIAVRKTLLLSVCSESVRASLSAGGTFSVNYTEFLIDRISFLNDRISSLTGYTSENRLLFYLKEHALDNTVTLPCSLSRFADQLGVGRASLYRALDRMEEEGTIERNGRIIKITGSLPCHNYQEE